MKGSVVDILLVMSILSALSVEQGFAMRPRQGIPLKSIDSCRLKTKLHISKMDGICLYGIQAFPYGFQKTLEVLMKARGVDYNQQAIFQWTTLPWTLKPLFASYFQNADVKSLQSIMFVLSCFHATLSVLLFYRKTFLLGLTLLTAAIATASYDIVLDSLMIKRRRQQSIDDMDTVNTEQAVGYKIGTMISGSLVLFLLSNISKSSSTVEKLFCASPIVSAALTSIYAFKLNDVAKDPPNTHIDERSKLEVDDFNRRNTMQIIWQDVRRNYMFYVLIILHKAGESMGDVLLTQFLADELHIKRPKFAAMKLFNDVIAMAGFMLPALLPRKRFGEAYSLRTLLAVNIVPQIFKVMIVVSNKWRGVPRLIGITSLEYFLGGAVTVSMSNFIFSNVIEGLEGTHYSFLASLEELGKMLFKSIALRLLAVGFNFHDLFLCALVLSVLPVVMVQFAVRKQPKEKG